MLSILGWPCNCPAPCSSYILTGSDILAGDASLQLQMGIRHGLVLPEPSCLGGHRTGFAGLCFGLGSCNQSTAPS